MALVPASPKSKSTSRKRQQSNADESVNKRNKTTADDNDDADEAAAAIEKAFEGPKGGRKAKKVKKTGDAPMNDLPSGKHTKTHTQACDGVTDS